MASIEWDPAWETGIPTIDRQHQQLVTHVCLVLDAVLAGQTELDVDDSLFFLAQYTDYHFREEERIMAESYFPDTAEHRLQHQEIRDRVASLARQRGGAGAGLTAEMVTFMADWIVRHIGTYDRALADHLRLKGIDPA